METSLQHKIARAVGYKGKKPIQLQKFQPEMSLNSYWSGGSRDYWFYVDLVTFKVSQVPQNGTMFDRLNIVSDKLEENQVLVKLSVYGSKQLPLIIYNKETT